MVVVQHSMSRVPQVEGSVEQHQPLLGQSRRHTAEHTPCTGLCVWSSGSSCCCWDGGQVTRVHAGTAAKEGQSCDLSESVCVCVHWLVGVK